MREKRDFLQDPHPKTLVMRLAVEACLRLAPFGAFVYVAAVSTNSVYIHFNHHGVKGKLRISDHHGKEHLKYKWNLIIGEEDRVISDNKTIRYLAGEKNADRFFDFMATTFNRELQVRQSCINLGATKKMQSMRFTAISGVTQATRLSPCQQEPGNP